jgi:autotransporter-associated beta strand protein
VSTIVSGMGTPTGTVTFEDGATVLGTVSLSGGTVTYSTSMLAAGSHSVAAIYGGDSNFTGSISPTLNQVIAKATTTTDVTSSNDSSPYGHSVTFTSTVTPTSGSGETGTVQFQIDESNVGFPVTLIGGAATYSTSTLAVGSHSVVAIYSGDSNFVGSTSPSYTYTITTITRTWDGGSTANNLWKTKENWVDDVAPVAGDNLIFPALIPPEPHSVYNDFTNGTIFGSITFAGAGYNLTGNSFQVSAGIELNNVTLTIEIAQTMLIEGNISGTGGITKTGGGVLTLTGTNTYSGDTMVLGGQLHTGQIGANGLPTTKVVVQGNATLTADSIVTDTLTIGDCGTMTISPISSGPESKETINDVDVITNTSVNNIKTDPISLDTSSLDPAMALRPVVIDQPLSAETIDTALAPAPVVYDQPLPAETIDTTPASSAPVALNLSLSAKPVEILPSRESSAKICDFLFSQPEQEVLFPTAGTNSLSNDAPVKSPGSEHEKQSNTSLVFDSVPGQKSFFPQSIISITSARDTALQQTLHEDWRADWFWNGDLENIKKRQKGNFSNTVHLAWALV